MFSPRRSNGGFTLTELLVVISLIVLLIGIAIPSFSFITGSASLDGAQNQISAFLGRARSEAIGIQQPIGVLFYEDPTTERYTMVMVHDDPDEAQPQYIDAIPDTDTQALPVGVALQMIHDDPANAGNDYVSTGVIMFNGSGQVVHTPWGIAAASNLATAQPNGFAVPTPPADSYTNFGFILAERETLLNNSATDVDAEAWLDENGLPVLVNRYNGTLIRGE